MDGANISLKIIVILHFVLGLWASMSREFLPLAYIVGNVFILLFGIWAIVSPESIDSVFMFLILNVISILLDIVFISVSATFYNSHRNHYLVGTYNFSLAMSIINLLVKPFSSFVLFRIYQDRGGQYSDMNLPGFITRTSQGNQAAYEDIDHSTSAKGVESPEHGYDNSTLP